MATKRHKAYIPLQRPSAKTYHTSERLVLIKTNLNLCKICVLLTTSQKSICDNMMQIIPRPQPECHRIIASDEEHKDI